MLKVFAAATGAIAGADVVAGAVGTPVIADANGSGVCLTNPVGVVEAGEPVIAVVKGSGLPTGTAGPNGTSKTEEGSTVII